VTGTRGTWLSGHGLDHPKPECQVKGHKFEGRWRRGRDGWALEIESRQCRRGCDVHETRWRQ
jgi:hypothetical protein